jgi:hypothetical protein
MLTALNNLAAAYMAREDYIAANAALAKAVEILERGTAMSRRDVVQILERYRHCLRKSGQSKARKLLEARGKRILGKLPDVSGGELTVDVTQLLSR